jgi:very-short-patch-repair endonuclease
MVLIKGKEDYPFYFGASRDLLSRAGSLRREMTNAENILWQKLRNKQIDGFRFRRQHPIDTFVADFFCYQAMLVVEVDGNVHADHSQAERDIERTRILNRHQIRVIRFTNDQVEKNINFVLNEIRRALHE